jgi:hypothetical protein
MKVMTVRHYLNFALISATMDTPAELIALALP